MKLIWVGVLGMLVTADGFQSLLPTTLGKGGSQSNKIKSSVRDTPEIATREAKGDEATFNWNKQWYPVLSLQDSDPERAHAVQLLGKDLVVWRNNEGRWSCFDDRCPHRAAPLTEGRVEKDGSLLCAYHAWRFDADGKCLRIPQSDSGGRDEAQVKACAKVYPTQVAQDMIWVWGENGPDAGIESTLSTPALVPDLIDAKGGTVNADAIAQRDVPYGWETLMENLFDPSHVVVSHHGIAGTRDQAKPLDFELVDSVVSKAGFSMLNKTPRGNAKYSTATLYPPSLAVVHYENQDGSSSKVILYGSPMRPGWCRLLGRQITVIPEDKADAKGKRVVGGSPGGLKMHKLPTWVQHVLGHKFLHQDMVFLHGQEKILASAGYDSSTYTEAVFVPTAADKGIIALRKWITKFGRGGPTYAAGCDPAMPPRERDRDTLFNVYEQHTKGCLSCLAAVKRVNRYLKTAKVSAVASLAWAILRGARAAGVSASTSSSVLNLVTARAMLPGLATMLTSLGAIKVLDSLHTALHTASFHHQDND